ncbi:MAG: TatD family hydrolase [Deltaproteobacteria bacterium]|nr:TatD family hydrolase [Deltaproteobacteria bacterium]
MTFHFTDTHCHLNFSPLCENIPAVLNRAFQNGVERIIVPAYDNESLQNILNLTKLYKNIYGAMGIHPWKADEDIDFGTFKQLLQNEKVVAIGEIGLDFKTDVCKTRQRDQFIKQLETAMEFNLPVLLHVRGAFEETLEILEQFNGKLTGTVHAFSRSYELAKRFIDLGFYISFGGTITKPDSKKAIDTVRQISLDNILLETDAPSIGLLNTHPLKTEPAHVLDIATALSKIKNISLQEISQKSEENCKRLFNL